MRQKPTLSFEDGRFFALVEGSVYQVSTYEVSGIPKNITEDQLKGFLKHGYLAVRQLSSGYGIEGRLRLLGGVKITKEGKRINENFDTDDVMASGILTVGSAIIMPIFYYNGINIFLPRLLSFAGTIFMANYTTRLSDGSS